MGGPPLPVRQVLPWPDKPRVGIGPPFSASSLPRPRLRISSLDCAKISSSLASSDRSN